MAINSTLTDKQLSGLQEMLKDAESCARLSQWEEEFIDDMRKRVLVHGADTRISDAQWRVIRRLEEKVYA
jgi:hypothetical protein